VVSSADFITILPKRLADPVSLFSFTPNPETGIHDFALSSHKFKESYFGIWVYLPLTKLIVEYLIIIYEERL
jgi:hypothetical protein